MKITLRRNGEVLADDKLVGNYTAEYEERDDKKKTFTFHDKRKEAGRFSVYGKERFLKVVENHVKQWSMKHTMSHSHVDHDMAVKIQQTDEQPTRSIRE